jgi:hypothetical protein
MGVLERGICPLCTGTEYELHILLQYAEIYGGKNFGILTGYYKGVYGI